VAIGTFTSASAVAGAINAANTGMTATVNGGALTLTGNTAGTSFTIADASGGNALATMLGVDSATKTTQNASLASLSIDGAAPVTSTSNTFTGQIPGVTINAVSPGAATLTVTAGTVVTATDEAQKKATLDAIRDMVNAFNDTVNYIKQNASYDSAKKQGGALLGDSMVNSLSSGLTRMFTDIVDDQSAFRTASTVGIELQRDGTLKLDEDKLRTSLENDSTLFKDLFIHEDGLTYNDANGQLVKVNSVGTVGSTVIGDGIANRISAFVDTLVSNASLYNPTDPTGARTGSALLGRIDTFQRQITDLDRQIEDYNRRLEKREKTLLFKFQSMEKAIAMLHNQGNYVASQFMSFGNFSSASS
jgi:flagellar capping protein FliD